MKKVKGYEGRHGMPLIKSSAVTRLFSYIIITSYIFLYILTPSSYTYTIPSDTLRPLSGANSFGTQELFRVVNTHRSGRAREILFDGIAIETGIPLGATVHRDRNAVILTNEVGVELRIESRRLQGNKYLIIGNATYLLRGDEVNLSTLNPLGNVALKNFLQLSPKDMAENIFHIGFLDAEHAGSAEIFPANPLLHPDLIPPKVDMLEVNQYRKNLNRIYDDIINSIGITIELAGLMHMAATVALNGDWQDYHMVQELLNKVVEQRNYPSIKHSVRLVQDYIQLSYIAYDKIKWERLAEDLRRGRIGTKTAKRTETLFEKPVEEVLVPPKEGYEFVGAKVLRVKALDANKDLKALPTTAGDEIFDLGSQRIKNGKAVSLFFSGGSGTAVKRVMKAHKMIHDALHVKISRDGMLTGDRWISIIEAHLGVALGQSPKGKIGVVTSLAGTKEDESDRSVQMKLHHAYPKKMKSGQLSVFKQKTGLVLDPRTGEPMRFSNGRLALCAEDHLWAFLSMLMYKDYIIDALRSGDNVVFLGNGDNVLNYSREGMSGFFDKARKEGKPLATVSIFAESSGDRQGGFCAEVTYEVIYREKGTGNTFTEEITVPRIVEISELPTRDKKQTGFTAIDLLEESEQGKKEERSDFYKQCEQNHWFIEDIFKEDPANPDSPDKAAAFNVSFHAIDLVLYTARIFGLDENDPELIQKLGKIPAQDWVDRVVGLGNEVVKSILPDKGVPNEVGSEEVTGLMTQQKVQDLIFNTVLRLLDNPGLPKPEVMGLTGNRMDFFAPYKGQRQKVPLPEGGVMTDSKGKAVEEYDLYANRFTYQDFVRRWVASGKTIPIDDDGREVVTEVILPGGLDEIRTAAYAGAKRLRLPVHFTPSAAPLGATIPGQDDVLDTESNALMDKIKNVGAEERLAFALLKTDVKTPSMKQDIIKDIKDAGFTVIKVFEPMHFDREEAERFYAKHRGKDFFNGLVGYMTDGVVVPVILMGPKNAWKKLKDLVGAPDGTEPDSLRAKHGVEIVSNPDGTEAIHNKIHASDSPEATWREINLILKKAGLDLGHIPEVTPNTLNKEVKRAYTGDGLLLTIESDPIGKLLGQKHRHTIAVSTAA